VLVPGDPPVGAIGAGGIGVGIIGLVPTGTDVPDGPLSESVLENLVGQSALHALVWKSPSGPGNSWSGPFPAKFACGGCVMGSGPDSLAPVACSAVTVQTDLESGGEYCKL